MSAAHGADLRISFAELTKLVQVIAKDAKIHLHNLPGTLFTSGSSITVAGQSRELPIGPKSFPFAGSTYAYYLDDVTSQSVRVSAIEGGLRLSATFDKKGAVLVGRCVSGPCTFAAGLPDIDWPGAVAQIDVKPVQFNGSVALKATRVQLLGTPRAVCRNSGGLISGLECNLARAYADRTIADTKLSIAQMIQEQINKPEIQQQLADGLKGFLSIGPGGAIAINNLTLEPKSMTVRFNFAAGG